MIILDKPYISLYLQKTARELDIPVLDRSHVPGFITSAGLAPTDEHSFMEIAKTKSPLKLYCNSENSIEWIMENLQHTGIPESIKVFKDKVTFRNIVRSIYPEFFYLEVMLDELDALDTTQIRKPFIIKPAVGFFSMGVYKVNTDAEWNAVVGSIRDEMHKAQGLYPAEVLDSSKFIIEEYIEGEEYAIDAYYNSDGQPVILNILKHPFSSEEDVSDRLYFTSNQILRTYLSDFRQTLALIGKAAGISNFPVHVEVRVDKDGKIIPIEVNPMRFAGWCTTDLAYYAYGINVYEYYFNQKEPDWEQILCADDNSLYCIVIAEVPKDVDVSEIQAFSYDGLQSNFSHLLELRPINYQEYPVFAFCFIRVEDGSEELDSVLRLDLSQYVVRGSR